MHNEKKYEVLMIDPPWKHKKGGIRKVRPKQGIFFNYNTMEVGEIFELLDKLIFKRSAINHSVFLWTIDAYLTECDVFMEKRGYKRHCRFIWNKQNGIAPAFTVRFTHEYLIWYYKIQMPKIVKESRGKFTTVLSEKSRQHSRKPEISYTLIEQLYPASFKIDVFSREKRKNWDQFGDEPNYYHLKF